MSIEQKFQAAVEIIQKLPKSGPLVPTNDEKLMFYSLYKQATVGKNENPQPGLLNFIEKAKWDAWKKLGEMKSEDAKAKYVAAVKEILERMSEKMDIIDLLHNISPELPEKLTLITAN